MSSFDSNDIATTEDSPSEAITTAVTPPSPPRSSNSADEASTEATTLATPSSTPRTSTTLGNTAEATITATSLLSGSATEATTTAVTPPSPPRSSAVDEAFTETTTLATPPSPPRTSTTLETTAEATTLATPNSPTRNSPRFENTAEATTLATPPSPPRNSPAFENTVEATITATSLLSGSSALFVDDSTSKDVMLHSTIDEDKEYEGDGDGSPRPPSALYTSPFSPPSASVTLGRQLDDEDNSDHNNGPNEGSNSSSSSKVNFSGLTRAINEDVKAAMEGRGPITRHSISSPIRPVRSAAAPIQFAADPTRTPKQKKVHQALMMHGHTLESLRMPSVANGLEASFRTGLPIMAQPSASGGLSESSDSYSEQILETMAPARAPLGSRSLLLRSITDNDSDAQVAKSASRRSGLSSKFNRRSRLANTQTNLQNTSSGRLTKTILQGEIAAAPSPSRRYKSGDGVLVRSAQSKWANLVNRHGFPPGEGETVEERKGPYIYVLATVKQLHFEEIHPYYTVTRWDSGADQRADEDFMEPLRTQRGEMAARCAATETFSRLRSARVDDGDVSNRALLPSSSFASWSQTVCYYVLLPFFWVYDLAHYIWVGFVAPFCYSCLQLCRGQAHLFLYGREPYICRLRLTLVNFVVACSTLFMFIDQARLAFFPPSSDDVFAAVSLGVWSVLILEFLFEVFIRPNGYQQLIMSDKAFAPTTVRYINAFHCFVESISLAVFVPEFSCIFSGESCSKRIPFSFYNAALLSVNGSTRVQVFYGRAFIAITRLRVFGLVRHWRNMWITRTFINMTWRSKQNGILSNIVPPSSSLRSGNLHDRSLMTEQKKVVDSAEKERMSKDAALTNASNIGTALMATNSYRALLIVWAVIGLFPIVFSLDSLLVNNMAMKMTGQLQATNLVASDTSDPTCLYLTQSVEAWLVGISSLHYLNIHDPYLLTLDLQPFRCGFDGTSLTNVRICEISSDKDQPSEVKEICDTWSDYAESGQSIAELARASGIREGSIIEYSSADNGTLSIVEQDGSVSAKGTTFSVVSRFNETYSIQTASVASLLLQLCLLGTILGVLSILRRDAEVLVLGPLRRMLKIVARYARNPLVQPKVKLRSSHRGRVGAKLSEDDSDLSSDGDSADDDALADRELGSFETEQLITAVAKITDLLRKCWGVAGADIISTNLATREGALSEVFNPTVPGKSVYALFGFAAIGGFENALRNLGGDVMPLINDIAAVLHGEVFRWGFGDSGQCNKNLGSAFLMVFRIGLVKEVIEKLEQATDVVFSTSSGKRSQVSSAVRRRQTRRGSSMRSSGGSGSVSASTSTMERAVVARSATANVRRNAQRSHTVKAMSLSLQSLPGISTFTDRAVIGMLKSYAGIYRDKNILKWNADFRLGAGVGAFSVSMIFGMDAGWAVEGAVGSEYKIDATYLSPHVNMASRMTSACKQYDVSIMLSQSVQELMSDVAQSKLRHLDTVTVKGSSVKQKIYTYDARGRGANFFLHSRSEEQADFDAERYSPGIWTTDQDLIAMRQHVTDDFLQMFKEGHKAYIAGDWSTAIQKLELANDIMYQTAMDEGYMEDEFDALNPRPGEDVRGVAEELNREYGDGPSMYLLSFMKSYGGVAPENWDGWHPLMRK